MTIYGIAYNFVLLVRYSGVYKAPTIKLFQNQWRNPHVYYTP